MTQAVCFKCGADKYGPLFTCGKCRVAPENTDEQSLSLVLSEHLSSTSELAAYAREIRGGQRLSVAPASLVNAKNALKDPQLLAMLQNNTNETENTPTPAAGRKTPHRSESLPSPVHPPAGKRSTTELHRNPFHVLGATTRDDRRRIVELAESKSLDDDYQGCQKARTDLTNPKNRLEAEIAWLPGVSPRKAAQLLEQLLRNPMSIRNESGLPTLAQANLMAAAFEAVEDAPGVADDIAVFIRELATVVDDLAIEDVQRDVNEDRGVSGFPEVKSTDQVEAILTERRRYYRNAVKSALNRLKPSTLVRAMTLATSACTNGGEEHGPALMDELVDSYEAECHDFLQKEASNVEKLIQTGLGAAPAGEGTVMPIVDKLLAVASNWDRVAQPIQLSAKARGMDHDASIGMARSIRNFAIELFNKHDMVAQSKRITGELEELFAELPFFVDLLKQDKIVFAKFERHQNEERLLSEINTFSSSAIDTAKKRPGNANQQSRTLLDRCDALLTSLKGKGGSQDALNTARDVISLGAMVCVIEFANTTESWDESVGLLERSLAIASSNDAKQRITTNLITAREHADTRRGLTPIGSAPGLRTINGIGFTLYGASDTDPRNGSHISTYYFVFFAIPLFPIARYRVIQNGSSYRFLGKAPLRTFDKWHIAVTCLLILSLFIFQ